MLTFIRCGWYTIPVFCNCGLILFQGSIHKMYNSLKGIKAPMEGSRGYNLTKEEQKEFVPHSDLTMKKRLLQWQKEQRQEGE